MPSIVVLLIMSDGRQRCCCCCPSNGAISQFVSTGDRRETASESETEEKEQCSRIQRPRHCHRIHRVSIPKQHLRLTRVQAERHGTEEGGAAAAAGRSEPHSAAASRSCSPTPRSTPTASTHAKKNSEEISECRRQRELDGRARERRAELGQRRGSAAELRLSFRLRLPLCTAAALSH